MNKYAEIGTLGEKKLRTRHTAQVGDGEVAMQWLYLCGKVVSTSTLYCNSGGGGRKGY